MGTALRFLGENLDLEIFAWQHVQYRTTVITDRLSSHDTAVGRVRLFVSTVASEPTSDVDFGTCVS